MGSRIITKNSRATATPTSLLEGELAYSANSGRLYIGKYVGGDIIVTEIAGDTRSSSLIGNISISGNTISSTNTNGDIILDPNGTGLISVSGTRITNVATPTASSDSATKGYVDGRFDAVSGDIVIASNGVATIQANAVTLGTDTTGNYVATIVGTADQISVSGSGTETAAITLSLPQSIATTSSPTFNDLNLDGDLVVAGNLTVQGTTTTVDSTIVTVADRVIELASDSTSTVDGLDRGVSFKIGNGSTVSDGFFGYDAALDQFTFDIDGNGSDVYVKGTLTADFIDGGTF